MEEKIYQKKKRIFELVEIGGAKDVPSRVCDFIIVAAILINITAAFALTFDSLDKYRGLLVGAEYVTLAVFIIEYIARFYTAEFLYPAEKKWQARMHFVRSADGIIEILTILPFFYLNGFVVFRMLRVVRIFQLFRINATFDSFNVITSVLYEKRKQLLSSVFIIFVLMMASSLFMYNAEHEAQPEAFENAFSGIWWSMSTMLTVGYGDISPITTVGQIMGIVIAFLGVGAVAIPTGIISAGFVERYTEMSNSSDGRDIDIQTVIVDIDSSWLGKTAEEVKKDHSVIIVIARRGSATILPNEEYRVHLGDALAIYRDI